MATRKTTTGTTTARTPAATTTAAATPRKKAAPRSAKTTTAAALAEGSLRLTPEQRHQWICTAAYYMAEHSGFQGNPVDFWLWAEAQVDQELHV